MAYIRFKIQLQLTFSQSAEGTDETGILDAVPVGEDGRKTLDALGGISVDSRVGVIVTPMSGTVVDPVLLAGHAVGGVGVGRGGRHGWQVRKMRRANLVDVFPSPYDVLPSTVTSKI